MSLFTILAILLSLIWSISTQGSPPCVNPINHGAAFCNSSLPIETRLTDLLKRLPVNQTPWLFGNTALGAAGIAMPLYQWWSEALHGVAFSPGVKYSGNVSCSTSFPQVILTGASFNTSLFRSIGDTIGREGRAMNNLGHAGLTFWAPNINIYRDPRWGRGQETPGEDPLLTSRYAHHFVRSMQNNTMDPSRLRVSSCCKHYLAYDMENWGGKTRFNFNAIVTEYDLENTYLPAFHTCVHSSGGAASGMMCSYNAENGIPSCANSFFMTTKARQLWGFNGYITSDCGATGGVYRDHHFTKNIVEAVGVTISSGMDIDCGSSLTEFLLTALQQGVINQTTIYTALRNTFRVLMRLGYFDPESIQPYKKLNAYDVNSVAAQKLAQEAAEQGVVLLNYNTSYLPWSEKNTRSVAVLGHNSNNTFVPLGNYFGTPPYVITPLQAIQRRIADVQYLSVLANPSDESTKNFDVACSMAQHADATVLVIGNDQSIESEGHDRTTISFPGVQGLLVNTVASCARSVGKQVTVVVYSGGSIDYSEFRSHPGVGGIFWAGYPGQSGGEAVVRILFGDVSPSGRLPYTVYPASFVDQVSMLNMQMEANKTTGSPGYTYRYYTGTPVYPFAWGLTYTTWSLIPISMIFSTLKAQQVMFSVLNSNAPLNTQKLGSLTVNVTNTGSRASAFSVLLKITPMPPGPIVGGTLSDFTKVFLFPQQSTVVELGVYAHAVVFGRRFVTGGSFECFTNDVSAGTFVIQ